MPHKPQSKMQHKDREEEIAFQRRALGSGHSVSNYLRKLSGLPLLKTQSEAPHPWGLPKEKST